MSMRKYIISICASLAPVLLMVPAHVSAQGSDELPIGEAVERHLSIDESYMEWLRDADTLEMEVGDVLETREVLTDELQTIKLRNLVPPVRFASGVADIPETTIAALSDILERMRHRKNVRLYFVGHADDRPLSAALAKIYGDNAGLSRERAGQVAEHVQTALALPPEAIAYEWAGDNKPVATNSTEEGRALNRRVEVEVWYDELRDRVALEEYLVPHEIKRSKVCRMETVCKLRYVQGRARRAKVQNLIAPLHFDEETINVSADFIEQIRQGFFNLRGKQNVVVKFLGYTDDSPLIGRMERIYGTNIGLSKARARRVALAVQDSLGLATAAVDSNGLGASRPLASNNSARGRARNRRIEVEFWYDDALQELPDEPQLCPGAPGAEMVTKVYEPPWGAIEALQFSKGQPVVPVGYVQNLLRTLADVADKTNARLRFVGYTSNEHLDRRTALVYTDDIGFSTARARRAMDAIGEQLQSSTIEMEHEGRGYVHSDDVVNAGFIQGKTSHVAVQVVYDELAILDDYEGVDITRMTRELSPKDPLGLNLMRITVDGEPIDDPDRSSSDIQRCTDVAFDGANIQFAFDNLRSAPRLSVTAYPSSVAISTVLESAATNPIVRFRMYTNYQHFIGNSEVRIFDQSQSTQSEPIGVVEIDDEGLATWQPGALKFKTPVRELKYVLRAYGQDGNFDETLPQPLWLVHQKDRDAGNVSDEEPPPDIRLLAAYGENGLARQNIGLSSGTVSVRGDGIPAGHKVWVAGRLIPLDESGSFITEEILPTGKHTVEVAIVDEDDAGKLYLRDLEFETNDWFYVGMADLTISQNSVNGPAELLSGENSTYDYNSSMDGRLAFFVDGKFGDRWRLSASADTEEGPLKDLFSNFMDKSPASVFRRIDPDYYYPTFGDDSTVEEMAPTTGKFFARLRKNENYAMWGNFKIAYMDNELAQVDRGLYGSNLHLQSKSTTSFGEQRFAFDLFAAEPGTIPSREEFRGTGGSLYFLQRQDISIGSERVRIEVRDRASGIVTGVFNLRPALDYDIDYLQGRIMLTEPLASTASDNLLVRGGALSGDEAYLVVRYEYSPGFEEIDALAVGAQAHYWVGDYFRVGLTSNSNEREDGDSSLNAADIMVRMSAESWFKLQAAKSEGLVSTPQFSDDGGFEFYGYDDSTFTSADAGAYRADINIGTSDFLPFDDGQISLYVQQVDAGFSAPGLTTIMDTRNYGGTFKLPIADRFTLSAKADYKVQSLGLEMRALEFDVRYQMNDSWDVSTGYRTDTRTDNSVVVPLTQEQGKRADAVVQLGYDSGDTWRAYGFVQDTVSATGNRQENARIGAGGSYRISDRLSIDAEISDGDLGPGGKIGSNYLHSDRTSMYLNYSLEDERTDNGERGYRGREGNLVAGVKSRFSDSASVYLEERYQYNKSMTGLTHATGVNLAPTERWNLGLNTDIGTLQDMQTGAETERIAGGLHIGYGFKAMQISSAIEYRYDTIEQADLSKTERTTWLFRNNFKYQITPGARLLGKLNHSNSESSLGVFYDGGFTEAVLGFAYRPVRHDRINTLIKYTYFYNVPTTDQITLQNIAAEFIQKTHIAAVDVSYDLTPAVSIGGKYAYRLGQVSLDRESPQFFDNRASLVVLRGDWRFRKNWEGLAELRVLDMPDLSERRSGALVTISRYIGDHLKVGIGYNFTDFSDDLTDLSFDHQGVFLNLTGAL